MLRPEAASKSFTRRGSAVVALRPTNLEIVAGEYMAVVGPSGSGKTTLLSMLGGMMAPTGGKAFLGGRSLFDLSVRERTELRGRKVGFVLQTFNLVPYLTALENVEVPLYLARVSSKRRSAWWVGPGMSSLAIFALALTRVDSSQAGRAYAAYGGVYILASLVWLWLVEEVRPDRWDYARVGLCLLGSAIISFGPRGR